MDTPLELDHERVDDIPLIIAMARRLGLPERLDEVLGEHGNHQGLSKGWLATLWCAYILSEGDHRKSSVAAWAQERQGMLSRLVGHELRPVELGDDRLSRLLTRLGDAARWSAIEASLWQGTVLAYALEPTAVRLDSTTSYGYHTPTEDGLMQLGHSKDSRPQQPQLKLMAAVAEPIGALMASQVYPGQTADDGLYVPIVKRVRAMTGRRGLIYIGDAKMAAHATRRAIADGGDFYLCRLPATQGLAAWVEGAASGHHALTPLRSADGSPFGEGFEIVRPALSPGDERPERVIVYQATAFAQRKLEAFDAALAAAQAELLTLTPPVGRGRRQIATEADAIRAIDRVLHKHGASGLLLVAWRREPHPSRSDPNRQRLVITRITERTDRIARARARLGWQAVVTNVAAETMDSSTAIQSYNAAWLIERQFYDLKDRPLGIQPLFVQRDDQIAGLTYLLTLAMRVLSLVQWAARRELERAGQTLVGLFDSRPNRTTAQPTARRMLRAVHRSTITLTHIRGPGLDRWHLSPLPPVLRSILALLALPESTYTDLARSVI